MTKWIVKTNELISTHIKLKMGEQFSLLEVGFIMRHEHDLYFDLSVQPQTAVL